MAASKLTSLSGVDFKLTTVIDEDSPDGFQHLKIFPEGKGISYDLTGDITDLSKPLEVLYFIKVIFYIIIEFERVETFLDVWFYGNFRS